MNYKICKVCGTQNENDYVYCKNCGAKLNEEAKESNTEYKDESQHEFIDSKNNENNTEDKYSNTKSQDYSYQERDNTYSGSFYNYSVDGVPADDVAYFVGKKANDIMPKFLKMEVTHSSVSWCWPVAILGFIMGPIGAALWFLYRKMYKIGVALIAAGLVLALIKTALTYNTTSSLFSSIFDSIPKLESGKYTDIFGSLKTELSAGVLISNAIENITSLAVCIIGGLFSFGYYKKFCADRIRKFRQNGIDQRYYRLGLASIGGVSGGMLAIGIISIIVIGNLTTVVTFLLSSIK